MRPAAGPIDVGRGIDTRSRIMLTVSRLSKSFGGRVLFEDASLQVNRGDRIALIGPNGAGKTTLFSILLGLDEPDKGEVALQRGVKVGFLPQETASADRRNRLAVSYLFRSRREHRKTKMPIREGVSASADLHQIEAKAKRILRGLGFRETDFPRQVKTMSGGWIMRAHLARLLVIEPELLLLDEPTNHLDLESLVWLQSYLRSYPGAILLTSHDRSFLNALAEQIVDIDQRKLMSYRGNYDNYVTQRAARQEQLVAAYKNQQREIKRLQIFIDRFGAKNTKASQAQSKRKQIERMEKIEMPDLTAPRVAFQFSAATTQRPQGDRACWNPSRLRTKCGLSRHRLHRGTKPAYGSRWPERRGKSTLLKLLGGVLPIQVGSRELGHNVQVGYGSQHRVDMLNLDRSLLEEAKDCGQQVPEQTVRTMLGAFLFRGDDVFKPVGVLSGGEKSRLVLAKLLLNPPNFFLLDEPTTHLDMASIEALIQALKQYEGTLLFISHDVYFIKSIATSVLHIRSGALTFYPGNYDYYLEKTETESELAGLVAEEKSLEI